MRDPFGLGIEWRPTPARMVKIVPALPLVASLWPILAQLVAETLQRAVKHMQ